MYHQRSTNDLNHQIVLDLRNHRWNLNDFNQMDELKKFTVELDETNLKITSDQKNQRLTLTMKIDTKWRQWLVELKIDGLIEEINLVNVKLNWTINLKNWMQMVRYAWLNENLILHIEWSIHVLNKIYLFIQQSIEQVIFSSNWFCNRDYNN